MKSAAVSFVALALAGCAAFGKYEVPGAPLADVARSSIANVTRTYYVDLQIRDNPCTSYQPDLRRCGTGNELAFNNLSDANRMASPGDRVVLREGNYKEQIRPAQSGKKNAPIVYEGATGEIVRLTGINEPAIWLQDVQHIHVRGLLLENVVGWARLQDAHNNVIQGNNFRNAQARGTTGGLKIVRSHYNVVSENTFYRGNDSIVIQDSDRNLVADNHFEFARHALFSIRCGNFNVLRNNYFHNERQKAGEIYDCEGVSDAPIKYDTTKRNLVEGNHFAFVRGSDRPTRYAGIQFSGQLGLVRRNLFQDNQGGAIHFAVYAQEALYNYGNRVIGNWFFDNRCYALSISNIPGSRVADNRVIGNLLAGNADCFGYKRSLQRGPGMVLVDNQEATAPSQDLPPVYSTQTIEAGSGTAVPVEDVLSFFDGYGIPGEVGDLIEVEATGERARLVRIDYELKQLNLASPLAWGVQAGVRVVETSAKPPFAVQPSTQIRRE